MYNSFLRIQATRNIFTLDERIALIIYELKNFFKLFLPTLAFLIILMCLIIYTPKTYIFENSHQETTVELIQKNEQIYSVISEASELSSYTSEYIYESVSYYANKYNLDTCFLLALIEKESSFNENAHGKDFAKTGSIGWSQATNVAWTDFLLFYICPTYDISWEEANEILPHNEETLSDIDISLTFICWKLNWLKSNFKIDNLHDLYAAYNGGQNGIYKKDAQKNADTCMVLYEKYRAALNN